MSVWRWKYDPEKCDHGVCVGDCDRCDREITEDEDRQEGEPIPHWRGQMDGLVPYQTEKN